MADVEVDSDRNAGGGDTSGEEIYYDSKDMQAREEGDGEEDAIEVKSEKPLDDDQDRRNPQYIPKGGAFYEHDNRTSLEDVENEDPQDAEKKKKIWKEAKDSERWLHDCYNEEEQTPKSSQEIIDCYGYDIRGEEVSPHARRRRKYGRGPNKYERSWKDEQAYLVKQSVVARRGKKKNLGEEEFPPLPNQKASPDSGKPVQRSTAWKTNDEDAPRNRTSNVASHDKPSAPPQANHRLEHTAHHSNLPGFHSNKKPGPYVHKKMNEDDIKPFRNDNNKWRNSPRPGRIDDVPKPIKTQTMRHSDPPFSKNSEPSRNSFNGKSKDADVHQLTETFDQMSFPSKYSKARDNRSKPNDVDESKVADSESGSPTLRQNPKRYSKIRKGFTGFFPPDEIAEIDPAELKQLEEQQTSHQQQQPPPPPPPQQHVNMTQQPMNMQNVLRRYPGPYNGNAAYMPPQPIISGIPPQGMSPQGIHPQALSPQGIPQQALSPQMSGLQTIEIQQSPLPPQPNFVPPPMFIDMESHFAPTEVMASFQSYPAYPSGNQTSDMYQASSGITYYSPECQSTAQIRPPPTRRPKAAIPIVPPPPTE